jgi:hypothetical protein
VNLSSSQSLVEINVENYEFSHFHYSFVKGNSNSWSLCSFSLGHMPSASIIKSITPNNKWNVINVVWTVFEKNTILMLILYV